MLQRIARIALAVLSSVVFGLGAASAQDQVGALFGRVLDEQGQPLPGVTVQVQGVAAPTLQVTDSQGGFRFVTLPPGVYQLTASLEGFSTVEQSRVTISVGRNTELVITLNSAVTDVITVTTESPLLDQRRISTGSTVSQTELDKIPTSRDPWAILSTVPGVQTDRINVGGNESGQQSVFTGNGANSDSVTWAVDGVDITDMAALSSPTYFDFDAFEELQITTGGSDVTIAASGATVNVVTKRGTNSWRGAGRFLRTDGENQADPDIDEGEAGFNFNTPTRARQNQNLATFQPNRIDVVDDFGAEMGGPLWRDRLWVWGAYGEGDIGNLVAGGQLDRTILKNSNVKLNAQLVDDTSATLQWSVGDKLKDGRGAAANRAPETTMDQSGPTETSKVEATHVFSPNFYLTGLYSLVDGGFKLIPKGGVDTRVYVLEDGIYRGSYYFLDSDRNVPQYRVDGAAFAAQESTNHEIKFGAGFREAESSSLSGFGGQSITYPCSNGGCQRSSSTNQVTFYRDAATVSISEYQALWLQDTLAKDRWTFNLGLRLEDQSGINAASSTSAVMAGSNVIMPALAFPGNDPHIEWRTLLPRLGATYALGADRRTLLRANVSRFAEQLPQTYPAGVNPVGLSVRVGDFVDANGNGIFDDAEFPSLLLFFNSNFDPSNPNSFNSPNQVDPGLSPTLTDELGLSVEHSLRPELVLSFTGTYRQVHDIPELQELVRAPGGVTRLAERSDYRPVTTTLTVGSQAAPLAVSYFDLQPGLRSVGTLLATGDREQKYTGLTMALTKRLSNRWMARASVSWRDWTWDVPDSYFDHHNPSDFGTGGGVPGFGSTAGDDAFGDRDGNVVAEQSGGSGSKGNVYLNAGWAISANALYQVAPERPWGFNVAGALNAREGYPSPLFRGVTGPSGTAYSLQIGDENRNDDVHTLDLRLDKEFSFGAARQGHSDLGDFRLTVSLDVFNVANETTVLQRNRNQGQGNSNFILETISPRVFRLGARLGFR